ncbi:MAG: hypothetical protein ACK559_20345, partial [bacterium]
MVLTSPRAHAVQLPLMLSRLVPGAHELERHGSVGRHCLHTLAVALIQRSGQTVHAVRPPLGCVPARHAVHCVPDEVLTYP